MEEKENNNGIVKWNTKSGEEYVFWTHSDYIMDKYIISYLKTRFPNMLIVTELNKIDFVVPEENIPIEVQSTPVHMIINSPQYSRFEQLIEKQIKQNINDCGICYLFFDSELLRAMKTAIDRKGSIISINMEWFRKFMKEGKLKVFTVKYDGLIEEIEYRDFDFLSLISQTCAIASETDEIILNKNKMKIYTNVLIKGYEFTQNELDKFHIYWKGYCKVRDIDNRDDKIGFLKKHEDERARLYGKVLSAFGNLPYINSMLDRNYNSQAKNFASALGIFDVRGGTSNKSKTMFVDKFDICKFFPSYIRNKEFWDSLKSKTFNPSQFSILCEDSKTNCQSKLEF